MPLNILLPFHNPKISLWSNSAPCTVYTRFLFPVSEAKAIFDANTVGPRAYVTMYDKYADILTGQSLNQKEEFLKSEATLDQFRVPFFVLFENRPKI